MRTDRRSGRFPLILCGLIPVIWTALLIAPYAGGGIPEIIKNFGTVMEKPFNIEWCGYSLKSVIVCVLCYGLGVGVYFSSSKNYRRGEEHGSAVWGSVSEIRNKYAEKNKSANILLTKNISISLDGRKHRRNLNVLVLGSSGAGKTRFYVKPNLMQANTSFIVLDPKGEILRDTGYMLEKKGYRLKVFDLINMEKSDCYNPFVYLQNENDVLRLATALFKATTPNGSHPPDPFWEEAAQNLMLALCFYLYYEAPPEEQNFDMVLDMLEEAVVKEDDENYISAVDELFNRLEYREPDHTALRYYKAYRSSAGKTAKSVKATLDAHVDKFKMKSVAKLTRTDELDLQNIGEEKTALFAIIPDGESSFNFLVSLLYSQLFQILYHQADVVHGGRLPVHVHFLMDEFANVALPNDFEKLLATMRSREISVSIIIQNIAQLKGLYKDSWENIVGNCDEFLYLGGNEPGTFDYVSKILGKETINLDTYGQSKGRNGSFSKNLQIAGRELMTPDEVRMLDNRYAVLFIRGERPVADLKYDILKHPNVKLTADGDAKPYEHGRDSRSVASIIFDSGIKEEASKIDLSGKHIIFLSNDEVEEMLDELEETK